MSQSPGKEKTAALVQAVRSALQIESAPFYTFSDGTCFLKFYFLKILILRILRHLVQD